MRVFIASGDRTFRSALLLLVETEPGMVVIGMSDRSDSSLAMVRVAQPEVLLLDYELARQGTAALIGDLQRLARPPKIIVLTINLQQKALAPGADAFVSKNVPPDDLLSALRGMRSAAASEAVSFRLP